jgi:hypothetical protein
VGTRGTRKIQEEHERPFGSSHVEDGGGDAQLLDQGMKDSARKLENIMGPQSRSAARGISERRNPPMMSFRRCVISTSPGGWSYEVLKTPGLGTKYHQHG